MKFHVRIAAISIFFALQPLWLLGGPEEPSKQVFYRSELRRIQPTILEIESAHFTFTYDANYSRRLGVSDELRLRANLGLLIRGVGIESALGISRYPYASSLYLRLNPVYLKGLTAGVFGSLVYHRYLHDPNSPPDRMHEPVIVGGYSRSYEGTMEMEGSLFIGAHLGGLRILWSSSSEDAQWAVGPEIGIGAGLAEAIILPGISIPFLSAPSLPAGVMHYFVNLMKRIRAAINQDRPSEVKRLCDKLVSEWTAYRPLQPHESLQMLHLSHFHPLYSLENATNTSVEFQNYGFSWLTRCAAIIGLMGWKSKFGARSTF